jgi:hypothetical protein
LVIAASTDWTTNPPAGTLQFSSITINARATLTVPSGIVIRSTGAVTINGTIVVAPNPVFGSMGVSSAPATFEGAGGTAVSPLLGRLIVNPGAQAGGYGAFDPSGGGPSAGLGGGSLVILAQGAITVAGVIRADGAAGLQYSPSVTFFGGGGGGGIIVLASKTSISGGGTLSAQGGAGATGSGGGGGGIVIELAPGISATPTPDVAGGAAGGTNFSSEVGGGGATGGNGGNSGNANGGAATAGATGIAFQRVTVDPTGLFIAAGHSF